MRSGPAKSLPKKLANNTKRSKPQSHKLRTPCSLVGQLVSDSPSSATKGLHPFFEPQPRSCSREPCSSPVRMQSWGRIPIASKLSPWFSKKRDCEYNPRLRQHRCHRHLIELRSVWNTSSLLLESSLRLARRGQNIQNVCTGVPSAAKSVD